MVVSVPTALAPEECTGDAAALAATSTPAAGGPVSTEVLAMTQPMISQTQAVPALDGGLTDADVQARLASMIVKEDYEIRKEKREVSIGRHPNCDIVVSDKRASGQHLRIYRDEAFHYFVENLSANSCFISEHKMNKGDTRQLQHGDAVSLCVSAHSTEKNLLPFAAWVFRVTDHDSEGSRRGGASCEGAQVADVADHRCAEKAECSLPTTDSFSGSGPTSSGSHFKTEQWVRENWDCRTVLGSGNFSQVRLGVDVRRGDKRAVKVMEKAKFDQFKTKRESHLSLSSEADVLKELDHHGLIKFYQWFETETHLYLITELMEGGDLLQNILAHGCLTEEQSQRLFVTLCEAVHYLHSKNIVHRDLKPENILLTGRDRETMVPKIADFGLARKNMKSMDCKTFCGTPHYFAPEVIKTCRSHEDGQNAGYGKQADMWSLGVILYIMLSGIPPFDDDGLYEQITEGKFEFDGTEWTTVSPEAMDLVSKLMTVNPKARLTIQQALLHPWLRAPCAVKEPVAKRPRICGGPGVDSLIGSSPHEGGA